MSDLFYPNLDLPTLRNVKVIRQLLAEHPVYFLESPYPGEVEMFFKEVVSPIEKPGANKSKVPTADQLAENMIDFDGPNKWSNLAKEAAILYKGLKTVKYDVESPNEQLSFYKTSSGLLEKLVGLEERALGLKKVHEFHAAVMEVMESVLTPTQRTTVMEKLQSVIEEGAE